MIRLLVLVGSLCPGSRNRQLAEAAFEHMPDGVSAEIFAELADVPVQAWATDDPEPAATRFAFPRS